MPSLDKWRSHASRSRLSKRQKWLRRIGVAAVILLVLAVVGAVREVYTGWRDASRFPAPGQFVQTANGRRHVVCHGTGSPAIVFEPSGFSNSTSFFEARAALSRLTRVCTYDRAGVGWSDAAPATLSAGMLADDLARVQSTVDPGRSVIVASSIGGLTAELFARRHPDRVAGLVFLDAANSEMFDYARTRLPLGATRMACPVVGIAGRAGLIRYLDPWKLRESDAQRQSAALMYDAKPWEMLCALLRGSDTTAQEFAAAPPLPPTMPVVALTAEHGADDLFPPRLRWLGIDLSALTTTLRETHKHLAARSQRGTWKVVPGSSHLIAASQPQAAIDAVTTLFNSYK